MAATDATKYLSKTEYEVALSRIRGYIKSREDGIVDSQDSEFLYRQSPNVEMGNVLADSIKGRTLVWNQLVPATLTQMSGNGITAVKNANGSYTINGTATASVNILNSPYFSIISGHKYLLTSKILSYGANSNIQGTTGQIYGAGVINIANSGSLQAQIGTANGSGLAYTRYHITSGDIYNNVVIYMQLFDLTLMFGVGNEPTTVEEFENLFPLPYYAYNAGELISFNATGIQAVGRNLWDEEWEVGSLDSTNGNKVASATMIRSKNYIPVFPNTVYYNNGYTLSVCAYDGNKQFIRSLTNTTVGTFTTPARCRYLLFTRTATTYNHDICINLSDPSFNGQYEPYKSSTLNLSIPSMTSGGTQIFPDGMRSAGTVYDETSVDDDGFVRKVVKRVGSVDLGTLSWGKGGYGGFVRFYSDFTDGKQGQAGVKAANAITIKYTASVYVTDFDSSASDKTFNLIYNRIFILDNSYADAAAFKTAMSGVMLYYELATPIEYTLDIPIYVGSKFYLGGTQTVLPENTTAPTTAPFRGTFKYFAGFEDVQGMILAETSKYLPLTGGTMIGSIVPFSSGTQNLGDNLQAWDKVSANSIFLGADKKTLCNTIGWYKVYKGEINLARASSIILFISRNYQNANDEAYVFSISALFGGVFSVTQLSGRANTHYITKIDAYVEDEKLAVAFYYSSNNANYVFVNGIGAGDFFAPIKLTSAPSSNAELDIINGGVGTNGSLNASSFIKAGGTSSQFLKADGSVDSTAYLPLAGGTITGALTASSTLSVGGNTTIGGTLTASSTSTKSVTTLPNGTSISAKGWYRIYSSSTKIGIRSETITLFLSRSFGNTSNEAYIITIAATYLHGNVQFSQLNSRVNSQGITKIRFNTYSDQTTSIDIYYNLAVANTVHVFGIGSGTFQMPTAVDSSDAPSSSTEFALSTKAIKTSGGASIEGEFDTLSAITLSGSTDVTRRIYFGDTSHFLELNSNGFHFSHGVYSDSFVSAGGLNSSSSGGGSMDLNADDLVLSSSDKLQFADRPTTYGMAYVILRRGDNLSTKMASANTIYEVRYNFDLGGATVNIGSGCVLKFVGGSFSNGTLNGASTKIDADYVRIFGDTLSLTGKWEIPEFPVAWYGGKANDSTIDISLVLMKILTQFMVIFPGNNASGGHPYGGAKIKFLEGAYYAKTTVNLFDVSPTSAGEGQVPMDGTSACVFEGSSKYGTYIHNSNTDSNFFITNLRGDHRHHMGLTLRYLTFIGGNGVKMVRPWDMYVEHCAFYNMATAIKYFATVNTHIKDCKFYNTINAIEFDSSMGGGGVSTTFTIENCWIQHCRYGFKLSSIRTGDGFEFTFNSVIFEYCRASIQVQSIATRHTLVFNDCYFEGNPPSDQYAQYGNTSTIEGVDCYFYNCLVDPIDYGFVKVGTSRLFWDGYNEPKITFNDAASMEGTTVIVKGRKRYEHYNNHILKTYGFFDNTPGILTDAEMNNAGAVRICVRDGDDQNEGLWLWNGTGYSQSSEIAQTKPVIYEDGNLKFSNTSIDATFEAWLSGSRESELVTPYVNKLAAKFHGFTSVDYAAIKKLLVALGAGNNSSLWQKIKRLHFPVLADKSTDMANASYDLINDNTPSIGSAYTLETKRGVKPNTNGGGVTGISNSIAAANISFFGIVTVRKDGIVPSSSIGSTVAVNGYRLNLNKTNVGFLNASAEFGSINQDFESGVPTAFAMSAKSGSSRTICVGTTSKSVTDNGTSSGTTYNLAGPTTSGDTAVFGVCEGLTASEAATASSALATFAREFGVRGFPTNDSD